MAVFAIARRCVRLFYLFIPLAMPLHAASPESAAGSLSLTEATHRVLANNPELQLFQWRLQAVDGLRQSAALTPGYELGVTAENVLGSGDYTGTDSAELTLSLSSVIELGDQRASRIAVADSRFARVQAEREARALDLLGLVTQRFVAALALQQQLAVAADATRLAETSRALVEQRVQRGAAPEAERLRAEAALIQARLRQTALSTQFSSSRFELAALWGAEQADFLQLAGDLFRFEPAVDFDTLYQRVAQTPAVAVFASEARLRDAELALARSQSRTDVQWSVGVRHFAASDDAALTAGVSVPLFAGRRNRGEVQAALAERDAVDSEREVALRNLRVRLFEAWQTHRQSVETVAALRADLLPTLERAERQTRDAYERGRYSYVDWVAAQRELIDARFAVIDAATTALLNQALIEQLTAVPLPQSPNSGDI